MPRTTTRTVTVGFSDGEYAALLDGMVAAKRRSPETHLRALIKKALGVATPKRVKKAKVAGPTGPPPGEAVAGG